MARISKKDDRTLRVLFIMLATDVGNAMSINAIRNMLVEFNQEFGSDKINKRFEKIRKEYAESDEFKMSKLRWGSIELEHSGDKDKQQSYAHEGNDQYRWEDITDIKHPDFMKGYDVK